MDLKQITWNTVCYQDFIDYLFTLQDVAYRDFHAKLLMDDIPLIGIRTPLLKQIAKQISKQDYTFFISQNRHYYYEEILLHGLVIGYLKTDISVALKLFDDFLPYNQNWAINDIVCTNAKIFQKNRETGLQWILKQLSSSQPWNIRFALVLLLDYYLIDDYIDTVLMLAQKSYPNHYYVNMAIAWLLSICYIKYPNKTISILENNQLDAWIHNKTISKIRDSYRVSKEKKDYLKTLAR